VAAALRSWGYVVRTLWEVYGEVVEQTLDDDVWIRDCGRNGWIALTRDYLRLHREAIAKARTRVFRIGRAAGNADLQIAWLKTNRHRIEQQSRKPGPYIRVIRETTVDPYWEP
jgi:hypothetical protein